MLLDSGANPNLKTSGGLTPGNDLLKEAVQNGDARIVELLLSAGAKSDAVYTVKQYGMPLNKTLIDFVPVNHPQAEKIKGLLSKTKIR